MDYILAEIDGACRIRDEMDYILEFFAFGGSLYEQLVRNASTLACEQWFDCLCADIAFSRRSGPKA